MSTNCQAPHLSTCPYIILNLDLEAWDAHILLCQLDTIYIMLSEDRAGSVRVHCIIPQDSAQC